MNRSKPVSLACAFWGYAALYFAAKGLNKSAQGNAWERAFPRKTRKISRERRSSGRSPHELLESSPVWGSGHFLARLSLDNESAQRGVSLAVERDLRPEVARAHGVLIVVTGSFLDIIGLDAERRPHRTYGRSADECARRWRFNKELASTIMSAVGIGNERHVHGLSRLKGPGGQPVEGIAERYVIAPKHVARVDRLNVQKERLRATYGTVLPRIMVTRMRSWKTTAAMMALRSNPGADVSGALDAFFEPTSISSVRDLSGSETGGGDSK